MQDELKPIVKVKKQKVMVSLDPRLLELIKEDDIPRSTLLNELLQRYYQKLGRIKTEN